MSEIEEVNQVVERMRNTKALRHLSDYIRVEIDVLLSVNEFTEVFKKELKIEHPLSDEQVALIIDILAKEI